MNFKKLILSVLNEAPVETPTKPETKPDTKPDVKPGKSPFRRPGPGHEPSPDAKKKKLSRIQRERMKFEKRHPKK
jgi:hypothetical protein